MTPQKRRVHQENGGNARKEPNKQLRSGRFTLVQSSQNCRQPEGSDCRLRLSEQTALSNRTGTEKRHKKKRQLVSRHSRK